MSGTERANDRQVDGTHYATPFQHWDLAAEAELGYFEGQISKYTTRHRKKNGLVDLDKAIHLTQKLIELAKAGKRPQHNGCVLYSRVSEYAEANDLETSEMNVVSLCTRWRSVRHLQELKILLDNIRVNTYPAKKAATHVPQFIHPDSEPGPGYVNQEGMVP